MKWEITSGKHWPEHLIEGEFPSRGTKAVDEQRHLEDLLREGWEPFAVIPSPEASTVWLKRPS